MPDHRKIWCCGCGHDVRARLTDGAEIYPHRKDLRSMPFWRCDGCRGYVGCHWRTKDRTRPLGNIPTKAVRDARQHIHRLIDPVWKNKRMSRRSLYEAISAKLGREYHTAEIRSVEEAREVYQLAQEIIRTGIGTAPPSTAPAAQEDAHG